MTPHDPWLTDYILCLRRFEQEISTVAGLLEQRIPHTHRPLPIAKHLGPNASAAWEGIYWRDGVFYFPAKVMAQLLRARDDLRMITEWEEPPSLEEQPPNLKLGKMRR